MSPEVIKYCKRAIIDYMAGDLEKYEALVNKAIEMSKQGLCQNCGNILSTCKYGHKGNKQTAKICMKCGQVYIKDEIVREGKKIC